MTPRDEGAPKKLCRFCGTRPAAPKHLLLMGHCSRNCLCDSLGETESDVGE